MKCQSQNTFALVDGTRLMIAVGDTKSYRVFLQCSHENHVKVSATLSQLVGRNSPGEKCGARLATPCRPTIWKGKA